MNEPFRFILPATIFPICFPTILRIVFSFVTASPFFIFNTADLRIDCSPLRRYLPGQFFTPLPRALFSKKIISQRIRIYSPRIANTFTRSVQWKSMTYECVFIRGATNFFFTDRDPLFRISRRSLAKNFVTGGCRVDPCASAIDIENANRPPVETNVLSQTTVVADCFC